MAAHVLIFILVFGMHRSTHHSNPYALTQQTQHTTIFYQQQLSTSKITRFPRILL